MQHMCGLLFSSNYLSRITRTGAMEQFYSTRETWADVPIQSYVGPIPLIRGALNHVDLRAHLGRLRWPMILIQSTSDALILPSHVESFASAHGPQAIATSVKECIHPERTANVEGDDYVGTQTHVVWLNAGHEILQERSTYIAKVLRQVLEAAHAFTASEP